MSSDAIQLFTPAGVLDGEFKVEVLRLDTGYLAIQISIVSASNMYKATPRVSFFTHTMSEAEVREYFPTAVFRDPY